MSGRSRHWREGKLITNRKTDRRRGPARSLRDRLAEINRRGLATSAAAPNGAPSSRVVRMAFLLPATLSGLVSSGSHGHGITVFAGGFVRIESYSAEQCFCKARGFFADVARDRPGFTLMASIMSADDAERSYGRHLTVVNGNLVVSGGLVEPKVFER